MRKPAFVCKEKPTCVCKEPVGACKEIPHIYVRNPAYACKETIHIASQNADVIILLLAMLVPLRYTTCVLRTSISSAGKWKRTTNFVLENGNEGVLSLFWSSSSAEGKEDMMQYEHENLVKRLARLTSASVSGDYNPHTRFEWPESLSDDQLWMSRELLSVYDTTLIEQLSEQQLRQLSKWESINFYSLNIHGIRELLVEVSKRLHAPGYEVLAEFFHRFLGEEHDHMWFFAQFCLRYGRKVYPDKSIKFPVSEEFSDPDTESFLIFSRILIFEELVDHFNICMGKDAALHPLIRQINAVHHEDESRHIAGGREIVKSLYAKLASILSREKLDALGTYLKNYMTASVESLYNPSVYRDAGLPDPFKCRNEIVKLPARRERHRKFTHRTVSFLNKIDGIVEQGFVP